MSSTEYGELPSGASIKIDPFTLSISDKELSDFKTLLQLSKLPPVTYEGKQTDRKFGINRDWLASTKEYWQTKWDWRKHEEHINSFPNFKATVKDDDGEEFSVHFVGLFSKKPDAIPIRHGKMLTRQWIFSHGWPGSFLEFLPLFGLLKKKYSAEDLPYHAIAVSLPGNTLSSGPPLDKNWTTGDSTRIVDKLAQGLGFKSYIAQGGDIGAVVSRTLALNYDRCKAFHLNMWVQPNPPEDAPITEFEAKGLERGKEFRERGMAYALEHASRPATIGAVLASSPLAVLAWIGEKFLEWSDDDPSVDTILESVTLWWFTETQPRAIYPYREFMLETAPRSNPPMGEKPFGFSYFPRECFPAPKSWVESTGNCQFYRQHEKGGHFAALERPQDLLDDVEEFVQKVWK